MNAKKNKKVLVLLSSVMALGTLGAVLAFSRSEDSLSRAGSGVSSSIVFSRESGSFLKIDDSTASISGQSYTGATYYAVSRNNGDISETNYVAKFGGSNPETKYVSFSTTATGMGDFEFQGITGIKVWTTSSSAQTLYVDYSSDGSSFSSFETISGSTNPDKYTFSSSHKYVRLRGYSVMERNVTKIELFYECGGEPEPATPDHIYVGNGPKRFEYGDSFVASDVYMSYSDESFVKLTSGLTFSGYDPEELGNQTISVSYDGPEGHFETSYTVEVYIATLYSISYNMLDVSIFEHVNIHDYIDDVDALPPSFEEGTDVEMEIILSTDEYFVYWLSIEEDQDWNSFATEDGVNFTLSDLPDENITVTIYIAPVE